MRTHTDRALRMLLARSHGTPLSLSNANLEMANLPYADLRGANLSGANLRGAMLWGALLDDACLDGADLTCANLTWSSLRRCSAKGALLVEADLDEAVVDAGLSDAITIGADMVTVTFAISHLPQMPSTPSRVGSPEEEAGRVIRLEADRARDTAIWRAHQKTAPPALRARGAAGFSRKGEELERARVRVLSDNDLQELLDWSATSGKSLNLRGTNLRGASLKNALLRRACLAYTDATGADTRGAELTGADRHESCGWGRPGA